MKPQIATDRSQSARLLKCGVSAESADMCLSTRTRKSDGTFIAKKHQTTNLWIGYPCWRTTSGDEELENVPAWSLSALLSNILPCDILDADSEINYSLFLQRLRSADNTPMWELSYYNLEYDATLVFVEADCSIEAAVHMVEILTKRGYKLNGIEKGGEDD